MVFCHFPYGPFSFFDVRNLGPCYRPSPLAMIIIINNLLLLLLLLLLLCVLPCFLFNIVLVLVFSSEGILVAVESRLQWYRSVSCLVGASFFFLLPWGCFLHQRLFCCTIYQLRCLSIVSEYSLI